MDPRYVDTAIRRWQRLTGKKAIHLDSGATFDQVEAEKAIRNGGDVRQHPVHDLWTAAVR